MLVPIIAILMVFGIPITAIISHTWLKAKKMDAERGLGQADLQLLQALKNENEELRNRIENIETILSDVDLDLLRIKGDTDKTQDKFLKN